MYLLSRGIQWSLTAIGITLVLSMSSFAGTDFYAFLEEPVTSSITGMGASGTASGMGGFTFYNPAGLGLQDKSFISFDFTRLDSDLGRGYIESGWVFPTWFIGGSFQTQSIDVQRTDITGILDGAYAPTRGTMLSILTGIKRERYSMGVVLNGVQEVLGDYKSYGFSGSVGLLVNVIPDHVFAGISGIHAAGRHNTYLDDKEKLKSERFPATVRGGVCLKDSLLHKFPTVVSVDVIYNDNDELVTVPVGIDFRILPPLTIRIGKRFNHPSDLFSMGLGLQWQNMAFDASFTPYKLGSDPFVKRSVGLTYSLPSRRATAKEQNNSKKQIEPVKKDSNPAIELIPQEVPVPVMQKDTITSDTMTNQQDTAGITDTLSEKATVDTTVDSKADISDKAAAQSTVSAEISTTPGTSKLEKIDGNTQSAADRTANAPVKVETGEVASPDTGSAVKAIPDTMAVPVSQDTLKAP
jgi:hypothetical protein